jgi:predicted RNA-binding Zn ribbon-like protein
MTGTSSEASKAERERIFTEAMELHMRVAEEMADELQRMGTKISAPEALRRFARALREEAHKTFPGRATQ